MALRRIGQRRAQTNTDDATTGETNMNDAHRKAAGQHELAAKAHRTAAERNEKGDTQSGNWHAERALEHSDRAYRLAEEAPSKSGQMVTL